MFEVGATYANRKGKYQVLDIDPPKMTVRYEDGTKAELNIAIQERIWENILGEEEVREASRQARQGRQRKDTKFYIKTLSTVMEEDLSLPGWRERVVIADFSAPELTVGDRLLFFAVENKVFFAVATVIGPADETVPKGTVHADEDSKELRFFPIDLDEHSRSLESAVDLDSVELESLPTYRRLLSKPNAFFQVDEDDFELVAEALIEIAEEEEDELEDEDEEEDYGY